MYFEATRWGQTIYTPSTNKKYSYLPCEYEKYDPSIKELEDAAYGPYKGRTVYLVQPSDASPCSNPKIQLPTRARAELVAAAMLRWQKSTPDERAAFLASETTATPEMIASYARARGPQTIPEDVRRQRVIADAAIREKRFVDAAAAYEDALDLAPWWGQGHFNVALVLAEIYHYRDAVNHMKKYLALTPDASDARQVQDKIYEWEDALRIKT